MREGSSIAASIGGRAPVTIASSGFRPAVATRGNLALIAWLDQTRLLAKRISIDGAVIDAQPMVITESASDVSVVTDATNFVVVWTSDGDVHAQRIGEEPFSVSHESGPYVTTYSPRAVWNGHELVFTFGTHRDSGLLISPAPFEESIHVGGATISTSSETNST